MEEKFARFRVHLSFMQWSLDQLILHFVFQVGRAGLGDCALVLLGLLKLFACSKKQ